MSNEMFNKMPVLVLNADKSLDDIKTQYKINERKILGEAIYTKVYFSMC